MQRKARRRSKPLSLVAVLLSVCSILAATGAAEMATPDCRQAVIEGEVAAGQGFDRVFATGLRFYLEPLRSRWIVPVLDAEGPREAHD